MAAVACDNTFKVPISIQYSQPINLLYIYIHREINREVSNHYLNSGDRRKKEIGVWLTASDYRDNLFKFLLPHYARDLSSNGILFDLSRRFKRVL